MYPRFTVRLGTQDLQVAQEVMRQNEYRLPGNFSPEDVILDVGAHIGCFALSCLGRGAGLVVCLEPNPDNQELLRENLAPFKDRVTILPLALWEATEGLAYLKRKGPAFTAMGHCLSSGYGEMVPRIGLAELLKMYPKVRLLKLDCEGGEWPSLFGVMDLSAVQEIVGELHHQMRLDCWPAKWNVDNVKPLLAAHGFETEIAAGAMPEMTSNFFARRAA